MHFPVDRCENKGNRQGDRQTAPNLGSSTFPLESQNVSLEQETKVALKKKHEEKGRR